MIYRFENYSEKTDFRKFYKNGDLRVLGSKNLYGKWNNLMYKLHKKFNPMKEKPLINWSKEQKDKYKNFINDLKDEILMTYSEVTPENIDDLFYDVAIEPLETEVIEAWLKDKGIKLQYDSKKSTMTDGTLVLYYTNRNKKKEDYEKLMDLNDKMNVFKINGEFTKDIEIKFLPEYDYLYDYSDMTYKKKSDVDSLEDDFSDYRETDKLSNAKDFIRHRLSVFFYNSVEPKENKERKRPTLSPTIPTHEIKSYKEFLI